MSGKLLHARDDIVNCLVDKPPAFSAAFGVRLSLRSLALFGRVRNTYISEYFPTIIRLIFCSWNVLSNDDNINRNAAWRAFNSFNNNFDKDVTIVGMTNILLFCAKSTLFILNENINDMPLRHLVNSIPFMLGDQDDDYIFSEIEHEISTINRAHSNFETRKWKNENEIFRILSRENIASKREYQNIRIEKLAILNSQLRAIDPNYSVWIDWCERRRLGYRAAFSIPGDKNRVEDKAIRRRLAEATDEDFWGKGHEYVNATLKGWLDEARARVAPPLTAEASGDLDVTDSATAEIRAERTQVVAALEAQASPQAQIVDGKLDAAPNTIFDKPQYSDDLAALPSELLAFTQVILGSLPRNCPPIVRNCFSGFRDEMLVRGNRPILNIVQAMAASLTAELYVTPDLTASPEEWELKDPREWGAGMDSMFASFFKGYHDLIHHFPLDSEREELIAATPIDEVAASGTALTQPVDEVAALIIDLGKQGFATENIVRIVEAHALYNRDIAQLPAPAQPGDATTPKRRHVLGTAGFYLNAYSVIGSTASIYALQTVPAIQLLLPKLKEAADVLLGFIK